MPAWPRRQRSKGWADRAQATGIWSTPWRREPDRTTVLAAVSEPAGLLVYTAAEWDEPMCSGSRFTGRLEREAIWLG